MASIPLLCNICPKEPEFSDISHLLTHVASKGHLSQYHKAQIRSRQDASIREKLTIYDRWYERYQIEKLLSQRMIAKESRETTSRKSFGNTHSAPAASIKANIPRKRRTTNIVKHRAESPSPVKVEGNIDPQLSRAVGTASIGREASPLSPLDCVTLRSTGHPRRDHSVKYQAHVPHMSGWQNPTTPTRASPGSILTKNADTSQPASDYRQETDSGSDYFRTFIRSPTRSAYPDPSELVRLSPALSPIIKSTRAHTINQLSDTDKLDLTQSSMLKGIKWPGMSLFDSASVEAQRRRNQKKDASIVGQMEQSSVSVEQIERIYWPDGGLKQQRLITGNVESSPVPESTPPSPPPKRQRTKANKAVLRNLSTNVPKRPRKPRASKAAAAVRVDQSSKSQERSCELLATPSPTRFPYSRAAQMGYKPLVDKSDDTQSALRRLRKGHQRAFDVYHDKNEEQDDKQSVYLSMKDNQQSAQRGHGHEGLRYQSAADFTLPRNFSEKLPWDAQLRAFAAKSHRFAAEEDRENIEPILDTAGRVDDNLGVMGHERATQRYFSVTSNHPPQFYNSMPPQMEFGGSFGPTYHGSSLNPLNTSLRTQHSPFLHPQSIPRFQPPDATGKNTNAEKRGRLESTTLARSRD